ncbi:MAG: polyphosphate kinase 1 [Coriobacteriia bacterium]|nr:polyphosphate kinase 1 [Coriobacteriia bacterium]
MCSSREHSPVMAMGDDASGSRHDPADAAVERDPRVATSAAADVDLNAPSLYLNREIELLKFQERVLEEAEDPANPLLERVKFLAIVSSNLAEFYMVRVAGLRQMIDACVTELSADGLTPREQLRLVRKHATDLLKRGRCVYQQLHAELAKEGIRLLAYDELDEEQRRIADEFFDQTVFPVLTPLAFDPGRPFPHISNLSLNLAVLLRGPDGEEHFARVKVPRRLPRLVDVSARQTEAGGRDVRRAREHAFVWLDQLIAAHLDELFPGMQIVEAHPFRVTRNAEMAIQELEADDLLLTIEEGLRRRRFGAVVRVTITPGTPDAIRDILLRNLEVDPEDVTVLDPPLGLSDLMALTELDRSDLKYPPFVPAIGEPLASADPGDYYALLREQDILLHRPFESFDPVVRLVQNAAFDPKVLAIKATLYRVGRNAPIVQALLDAAREGKEVTALVELKARFDEESNIEWARALEAEGAHVIYGLIGLKTHCKALLIVRKEGGRIRRYVHIGTGNYNTTTATQYTDLDLLTADESVAEDASQLFNKLTGYALTPAFDVFSVSPGGIRPYLERRIRREIEHARNGRPAHIVLKANALTDRQTIRLLYEASMAGVRVELIIRGICCLRPGVPGVSENITVRSIVGRFLEHTRIYYFANDGDPEVLIGSADLMSRSLERRVELVAPVLDPRLKNRLKEVLDLYLADNVKARVLHADGTYHRVVPGEGQPAVDAQTELLKQAGALLQKK